MATFYLINSTTVGHTHYAAGALINSLTTPTAPIEAAGGLLWTTLDPDIKAAGLRAAASKDRSPLTLRNIMYAGANASLKAHDDEENIAPAWYQEPYSQTVDAGNSVFFAAGASGVPAPSYQWYRNGALLAGQTTQYLSILSAGAADEGTYYITATNLAGMIQSVSATLHVVTKPEWIQQPNPTNNLFTDGPGVLFAQATGPGPITYQWYKNGVAILGATDTALDLTPITAGDAGTYVAKATNSFGTVDSVQAVVVVLNSGVAFTVQPAATQAVAFNGNATFTCTTAPVSTYYYLFVDAVHPGQGGIIDSGTSPTFVVNIAIPQLYTTYRIAVQGAYGLIFSDAAVVTP